VSAKAAQAALPVTLFVGEPSLVDPLVQSAIDQVLDRSAQSLNLEVFRGGERPLAEALLALRQVGMFASRRCVWIRGWSPPRARGKAADPETGEERDGEESGDSGQEALLGILEEGLPAETFLFVSATSIDARSRLYKYLAKHAKIEDLRLDTTREGRIDPAQLATIVEARLRGAGVTRIGAGAIGEIVSRAGTNIGELLQEVDRLTLTIADPACIEVEHVRRGMRDLAQTWVFDFTGAVSERRLADAERMIERLLADGEPPLRLTALLATHIGELMEVRPMLDLLPRGAMQMKADKLLFGPMQSLPESFRRRHPSWRGYFRLKAASNFEMDELLRLHREVVQLDLALKSSRVEPLLLFSRLLQSSCRAPAHGRGRA